MRRSARLVVLLAPWIVVLGLSKVHASLIADPKYDFTSSFRLPWALSYAVLLTVFAYAAGLPDVPRTIRQGAGSALVAVAGAAGGVSVLQLLLGDALLPRFVVFGSAAVMVSVDLVAVALALGGRARDEDRDRVVVVGSVAESQRLVDELVRSSERPATVVAQLRTADVSGAGDRVLLSTVIEHRASVVVLDRSALLDEEVVAQAATLHEFGVRVRTLLQFYGEWLGKLPLAELERASLFFDISELHRVRFGRIKRMTDLVWATAGLLPLALITPVVAVGNLVGNRGPLLYRQVRVGQGGQPFEIVKFRTMVPVDPGGGAEPSTDWTTADDPRITRFGRLLRTTHLDELPQVINILRGDLAMVGPRPEQPRYVAELSEKLPFYGMRHLVRPGLTGWAQVKYGYAGDEDDALEKLQYEFFYLQNQGIRFDLLVVGRTVRSVVGGAGRGR